MKKIRSFALLVLVFLAAGICAAEVPDLLGNWTGSWSGYEEGTGYSKLAESGRINFAFTEQEGRVFSGNLIINLENDTTIGNDFAGAIGLDNKTLYIAEFGEGYSIGTIVSNDEIELIYLMDGEGGSVAIDRLHRIKA
jgi:hypothetical protein